MYVSRGSILPSWRPFLDTISHTHREDRSKPPSQRVTSFFVCVCVCVKFLTRCWTLLLKDMKDPLWVPSQSLWLASFIRDPVLWNLWAELVTGSEKCEVFFPAVNYTREQTFSKIRVYLILHTRNEVVSVWLGVCVHNWWWCMAWEVHTVE